MAARLITLTEFRRSVRHKRFEYGVFDCCLFGADWIQAVSGYDPAEDLRGTYSTKGGAAKIILRAGGMKALLDARVDPADRHHVEAVTYQGQRACAIATPDRFVILTPSAIASVQKGVLCVD